MSCDLLSRFWPALAAALMLLRTHLPRLDTLTPSEGRGFRAWLRALETLARRAVLIEAVALKPAAAAPKRSAKTPEPKPARAPSPRKPRLRLWPAPRFRARVRLLGPPTSMREIWRENRRAALIARLKAGRCKRKPAHLRFADRLDALERLIAAPGAAARRLARKLASTRSPAVAITIARQGAPRGVDPGIAAAVCQRSWLAACGVNPSGPVADSS